METSEQVPRPVEQEPPLRSRDVWKAPPRRSRMRNLGRDGRWRVQQCRHEGQHAGTTGRESQQRRSRSASTKNRRPRGRVACSSPSHPAATLNSSSAVPDASQAYDAHHGHILGRSFLIRPARTSRTNANSPSARSRWHEWCRS
jgi:hypothetical protein